MRIIEAILVGAVALLLVTTFVDADEVKLSSRDAISFTAEIKPVFQKNCNTCHADQSLPDVTNYNVAYGLRAEIVDRVYYNRSMPKHGPFLTESERELVKLWVDTGANK